MNADSILRELAQMARPVSASAAMQPPGPGCLTAAQMRQLAGGGPTPEATLLCLTEHVPHCDRCWSLVCVVLGRTPHPIQRPMERSTAPSAVRWLGCRRRPPRRWSEAS